MTHCVTAVIVLNLCVLPITTDLVGASHFFYSTKEGLKMKLG